MFTVDVKQQQQHFFKNREQIRKEEHGTCFAVSAIQVPSVTLTISGDESQRKAYRNIMLLIKESRIGPVMGPMSAILARG